MRVVCLVIKGEAHRLEFRTSGMLATSGVVPRPSVSYTDGWSTLTEQEKLLSYEF